MKGGEVGRTVRSVTVDGGVMEEVEDPAREAVMMSLLVGGLTGQYQLSDEDRRAVGEWMVGHTDVPEVRELLIKIVSTQIVETSEFRVQVAEAIRQKFQPSAADSNSD
jgi:hypothetical protein